jgi:hypothetical protein
MKMEKKGSSETLIPFYQTTSYYAENGGSR